MTQDQTSKKWSAGKIVKLDNKRPRSYVVKSHKTQNELIRNRRFLIGFENKQIDDDYFSKLLGDTF